MRRTGGENLFDERRDLTNDAAWACVVYSLVPFLGILFLPFGLGFSVALTVSASRSGDEGGRRLARMCLVLSVAIAVSQGLLWYLLYFIPTAGI